MGLFFAPETDMIFGDGVGASLVRGPYCQFDVGLCDIDVFLHWNSAAEEVHGWAKTGPLRRHRIQPAEGPFLDLRAKETCF